MLRPWTIRLIVNPKLRMAVYMQIANAIIEEIRCGRLEPGSALPGSRELAANLGINRKTAIQAYDELVAQGWLEGEKGRGTFVSTVLPALDPVPLPGNIQAHGMPDKPYFPMTEAPSGLSYFPHQPNVLTFDDGVPDTRLIPAALLARAYRGAVTRAASRGRLGYGDPRGAIELRRSVSAMLNLDRGMHTTVENICLARGSQMAIWLAARALVHRGDCVVFESLSYPAAREAFRAAGAEIVGVGLDGQGLIVDELERICRRKKVRAIYLTPHHQFPTTVMLKPDRRLRLLALADQFGFAIVEDDYDHEFNFSHKPMLPLASADPIGKVIYIGSLSKLLAPGLRAGYLAAPAQFVQRVAAEIMLVDRQGDPATELAIAELIEAGEVHRHERKVVPIYQERLRVITGLLRAQLSEMADFTVPEGGLALWVKFPAAINSAKFETALEHCKLRLLPSRAFSATGEEIKAARLGYASMNEAELAEAVRRLKIALQTGM